MCGIAGTGVGPGFCFARIRPKNAAAAIAALLVVLSSSGAAQTQTAPPRDTTPAASRAAIVAAEDRRAPTAADLATIRSGVRSGDAVTARIAVRALGRLERPELIAELIPVL